MQESEAASRSKDCIVFLTHFFDKSVERAFTKLFNEAKHRYDVYILCEKDTEVPERISTKCPVEKFDFSKIKEIAKSVIGDKVVPGNCHLRTIDFFNRFPQYSNYWFVEYDVRFTGNWGKFFEDCEKDESDLLGINVRQLADDPTWFFHDYFSTPEEVSEKNKVAAFLPIHRLSAPAIATIESKVKAGWTGHFELLIPSALRCVGQSISEISGDRPSTPPYRKNKYYILSIHHGLDRLTPFRYSPPIIFTPVRNFLYHPLKSGLSIRRIVGRFYYAIKVGLKHPVSLLGFYAEIAKAFFKNRGA